MTEWSWNMQTMNEYCSMLLTLSTCNNDICIAAQEYMLCYLGPYYLNTNVFSAMEAMSPWGKMCHGYGTHECRLAVDCADTKIPAVKWGLWRSSSDIAQGLELSQLRNLKLFLNWTTSLHETHCSHLTASCKSLSHSGINVRHPSRSAVPWWLRLKNQQSYSLMHYKSIFLKLQHMLEMISTVPHAFLASL